MLAFVFRSGRFVAGGFWLLLIAATVALGWVGFRGTKFDNGSDHSDADAAYKAACLLAIQTGSVPAAGNTEIEIARWCGLTFWVLTLASVVIALFREPADRLLVKLFARRHVLVAGLGDGGGQLVLALRKAKRGVVVVVPDRDHPAVGACRAAGAAVLFGAPDDLKSLAAANLHRAAAVLALFADEAGCVRTATAAYHLLKSQKATRRRPPVRCVLRLTEPGLLDVIRRHQFKTDPADRFQLEILNAAEIAATTMVREAGANSPRPVRKLLVLSLGTHHRLGEMVVLRAAKDWLIAHNGRPADKLTIDVYDQDADEWKRHFDDRHPQLAAVCDIRPKACWARKVGACQIGADYDAAFVCVPDDGPAVAQAVMVRRLLTAGQPVMVAVRHSGSGFGELAGMEGGGGWGPNLHPVGLDDPLIDPDLATGPELELRARAVHQDYRSTRGGSTEASAQAWAVLPETWRKSNRTAATRYADHLRKLTPTRYALAFDPDRFTRPPAAGHLLHQFDDPEVEQLAALEHAAWCKERKRDGWQWGKTKDAKAKTHPLIDVPFDELPDADKDYNRRTARGIPAVMALADYAVVIA